MKTIFQKELQLNFNTLLIWSLSVGGLGLVCILLYQSMQGDMAQMADAFSDMGAFSDAFGMSTLSIATLGGYFATEVGVVHGLGSAMFAAILSIGSLSGEEEGHTGEFLFSLPVSRRKVIAAKGLCVISCLVVFTLIAAALYLLGFELLDESVPMEHFVRFMACQFLMNLEVAAICFALSALSGKNRMGLGLALALLFYFYDLVGRVVPDLKDYLYIGPFSYANASEIFSGIKITAAAFVVAFAVIVSSVVFAFIYFERRDLAS
ncbi:MAG: ABC transporter permease [Lachnospiraceae bacterium]|nr:ABC transporter permease [Lachnospiraceae bacterium]